MTSQTFHPIFKVVFWSIPLTLTLKEIFILIFTTTSNITFFLFQGFSFLFPKRQTLPINLQFLSWVSFFLPKVFQLSEISQIFCWEALHKFPPCAGIYSQINFLCSHPRLPINFTVCFFMLIKALSTMINFYISLSIL